MSRPFQTSLKLVLHQYLENSTVDGMWLLRSTHNRGPNRFLWFTILVSLLVLSACLSKLLWEKFYSLPTIVTIETHNPVTTVAFPGVTICSPLPVMEHKLESFMDKIKIPPQYNIEDVKMSLRSIEGFTIRHNINRTRYEIAESILKENQLSVYAAIQEIGANCNDLLQFCYWGSKKFPCSQRDADLTFTTSISQSGSCCSFNYYPENQSYIPFSSNSFGIDGGLVIVGQDRVLGNTSTGLIMRLHHPLDYAVESAEVITLNPFSETFAVVYPVELTSSAEVLELSPEKRKCQIASDFQMSYYRQAGCILKCQQQLIYKTCGCHPYQYPNIYRIDGIRDCLMKDIECLVTNFDVFRNVKCGNCLPNCYDVSYSTTTDYTDIMQHNVSNNLIYSDATFDENSFIVRVYLANQVVPSHRKMIVMSIVSLLADLGGVFNLCLGISIISVVEVIYFFTYKLYVTFKSQSAIIYVKGRDILT